MRRGRILIALMIGMLAGCSGANKRPDPEPPFGRSPNADFTSRPKDVIPRDNIEKTGGHWVEGPYSTQPPKGNAPPADSYVDPLNPNFNSKNETRGVLAGFVIDPEGRKAGKLFVQVEPLPSDGRGAPLEVETLADGSFLMKGLEPGRSYRLTTRATDGTRILSGRTYTKAPNMNVRISLIEGLTLEESKPAPATTNVSPQPIRERGSPKDDKLPDPFYNSNDSNVTPNQPLAVPDLSTRELQPRSALPTPLPTSADREFQPTRGDLPETGGGYSPTAPSPTRLPYDRPDLTTNGPQSEWKPPVTNIPRPSTGNLMEPPPLVPLREPGRSRSQVVRPANEFVLADCQGRSRSFPSGRAGDLLLLEFMTTQCVPCLKSLPELKKLQQKYGEYGLEIVGLACDEVPYGERLEAMNRYRVNQKLNFPLLTEATKEPGALVRKFGVDRYPTAVLLDSQGAVLWQGNPTKKDSLIAAIEEQLRK